MLLDCIALSYGMFFNILSIPFMYIGWVGGVPSVVSTCRCFCVNLLKSWSFVMRILLFLTLGHVTPPSLHSAKFNVYALESRERDNFKLDAQSISVVTTFVAYQQCFCRSFSGPCNVGCEGGLTGQVQTKQAVTVMMPLHHHSGTGAPAQENSALIVWATGPPSMACLKAPWSRPWSSCPVHLLI